MAHQKTKTMLQEHLDNFARVLVAACGPQMGINEAAANPYCKRQDAVVLRFEQSIRYQHSELNRYGEEKTVHFRNDAVAYVRPGLWGLNSTADKLKTFTAGIEIKEDPSDLKHDDKILFYMGWTDFYFILVPHDMTETAVEKIHSINDSRVGLIVHDDSEFFVRIVPQRQQVLPQNQYALALQALFSDENNCADVTIDWDGIPEDGIVDVNAYRDACSGIHPEFAGHPDTYVNVAAMPAAVPIVTDLDKEAKQDEAAARKVAKLARETALAEDLKKVKNEEIRHRLVAQSNDTQSVYHTVCRAARLADGGNTVALTAEAIASEVGVSKSTVETSLRNLRTAGLIESAGSCKTPQIRIVEALEGGNYHDCLLYNSVKSPTEKRRMRLVCAECSHTDCPAHQRGDTENSQN